MIKNEKKFFWLVTAIVLIILSLPPIISFYQQLMTDNYYTGIDYIAGSDKTIYLSYMEQAKNGDWLFKNLYTSEPQTARLFSPLWLALGNVSRLFNISSLIIFQLFKIIFAGVFLYLIYNFASLFFEKIWQRRTAFLIILFSSGFGFFLLINLIVTGRLEALDIFQKASTDAWISESNIFLTILHSPLFILSQILIVGVFWLFIKNLSKFNLKSGSLIFLLILFLGFMHPYDLIIICAVIGVFCLMYFGQNKKIIWATLFNYLLVLIPSAIAVIYYLFIFNQEQSLGGWAVQNVIYSPPLINYFLGYGLIFLFFIVGLLPTIRQVKNKYCLFILVWALTQLALLYFPVSFQTKLSNGLHLPLVIIACYGIFWLGGKMYKTGQYLIKTALLQIVVLFLVITTTFNYGVNVYISLRTVFPYYLDRNTYQAMLWLKTNQNW